MYNSPKRSAKREIISAFIVNVSMLNEGIIWNFIAKINGEQFEIPTLKEYILILCVTIGFVCGAIATDLIGRKITLIASNVSLIVCWLLFKFSVNSLQIHLAYGLLYYNSSLFLIPVVIYVSEISQPKLRSILLTSSFFYVSFGAIIEEVLYNYFTVRVACLMNCIVPSISIVLLLVIPESPYWLLMKKKMKRAKENLIWFVGKNQHYVMELKCLCEELGKPDLDDLWIVNPQYSREENKKEKSFFDVLIERQFVNTLSAINFVTFVYQFSGSIVVNSSLKKLFDSFSIFVNVNVVIIYEILQISGTLICIISQHYLGRRLSNMTTISLLSILNLFLAIYCLINNVNYDKEHEVSFSSWKILAFLFLVAIIILNNTGLRSLPWLLSGELFEYRLKCYGVAFVGIFTYILQSLFKSFFKNNVEELTLSGMYLLYSVLLFFCLLFVKINLIESDGKSLYDVQKMLKPQVNENLNNERGFRANDLVFVHCT